LATAEDCETARGGSSESGHRAHRATPGAQTFGRGLTRGRVERSHVAG
jgi:hypothetical protein